MMGQVKHVVVESSTQLSQMLSLNSFLQYREEFQQEFKSTKSMEQDEDWSTEPELLEIIYCYIRERRPHTIVEIGTYKGYSAIIFAKGLVKNDYGHLYTIDDNQAGVLYEAKKRFSKEQIEYRITLINKSSQAAFIDWGRAKIDLLYIDGSHSFLDSCCDFALWARYVIEGGIIIIHDTVTRLLRRFPDDYIYPLCYYDVLNITDVLVRPSGQEWEGCGFVTVAKEFIGC